MAKLFSGNNSINPAETNIATEEQNQAEFLSMQKQSQVNQDFQTQEYLSKKKKEQSGDLDSALNDSPGLTVMEQEYAGQANPILNQDMSQQPKAEDLDDINRSWASQFQESFIKGFGETVVGSTGDVINLLTAPLPGFSIMEGNMLGRALRDYGDEMGNEHTTFLAKKLEGQELSWGSLVSPDFWSTQGAEMLPMMIEFMVTGAGAGAAAKKGMGLFLKSGMMGAMRTSRVGGVLGESALAAYDTSKMLGKGVKVAENVLGKGNTGTGLAKYLARNIEGSLEMSKFSNEFVNAAGAGMANNLLAGATNAMDYHRSMKAQNQEDIDNGIAPRYTEAQMANVATESMKQNLMYAPVDMLSWGISYAKAGEKLMGGMAKKVGLKAADKVAKEAAEAFTKTTFPIIKGLAKAAGHAVIEGTEETFQETYEQWASKTSQDRVVGNKEMSFMDSLQDYAKFYNSAENNNTIIASAAMGGLFGGAMNLKFNESAQKGLDHMNRQEMLTASIDATDTGGQAARTWHIRNTMVDLLYGDKTEAFDGFISDQLARGNITPEEVESYQEEFEDVSKDYQAATSLNIAGKHALFSNMVAAKSLERSIANEQASYDEKIKIISEQFGEQDESVLDEQERQQLEILKEKVQEQTLAMTGKEEGDAAISASKIHLDALNKKIKDRSNSKAQKQYAKLKEQHEQQIDMLNLNLAQSHVNRLNLISGEKADPLNIKFWVNKNGNEMAYIQDTSNSTEASWVNKNGKMVREQTNGFKGNEATIDNSQRVLELDPETMSEDQMGMAQEQGDIVAGLSKTQYENFVNMTEEEVMASARVNHEKMLAKGGKALREQYDKLSAKLVEFGGKMKAKLKADGTPELDQNGDPVMEPDNSAVETKVAENLATAPEGDPNAEKEMNAYEKEFEEKGLETAAEKEAKRVAEKEAEFLADKSKNIKYDADGNAIVDEQEREDAPEVPKFRPVKDKVSGKYSLVDEKTGEAHPNGKTYSTSVSAKKDLGNASIVGEVAGGLWSVTKGAVKLGAKGVVGGAKLAGKGFRSGKKLAKKAGEAIAEGSEEAQNKLNQIKQNVVIRQNMAQNAMRRAIIEQAYHTAPGRNNANNPVAPVSKNQLDAYLDTKIAAFKYGPRAIDEQYTINRMLKAKGITANVVIAQNLFSLLGIPAVGYALASTIYIDENVWNQPEVFMHEMAHINYQLTSDKEETKAVVKEARQNEKLVAKIERLYADKVVYQYSDGTQITLQQLKQAYFSPEPGETAESLQEEWDADMKQYGSVENMLAQSGITKLPDSEQHTINEELFTHFIQGPMAKNFDKAFEPIKERRRIKVTKGWWAYLKGKDVSFEPYAIDVAEKLANGKSVPRNDLMNHLMDGFATATAGKNKKLFTGSGFASAVDMMTDEEIANHQRITDTKIEQRKNYDPVATKAANKLSTYDRIAKSIKEEIGLKMKEFSETERQNEIDSQLSDLEDALLEDGAFDDYESAKSVTFRGATRILNSFTKSLNYVKRKRFLEFDNLAADFDEKSLIDREVLVSEFYNLAFETKGDTNAFIAAIENSRVEEVWQFNQYMEKMHPNEKMMYLSSMAYVMGNQQTISAVKSVVNSEGKWETHNALSETEKNKVDNHMTALEDAENSAHWGKFTKKNAQKYQYFLDSYKNIKNGVQTNQDYLHVLRTLAPNGLKFSELINNKTINMRGHNVNVKTLIDKMVHSKVMENTKSPGKLYIYNARPFVEALVDSNRKFTSYSVIQNAEGNMEPSKITNNHLLSELNDMNDFLVFDKKGTFPSFKSFKERYAHLSDSANRTHENPVLRSIFDNAKNGILRPSVAQYVGLTHLQRGNNSLYKNSTAFTQSIEDFMMFANVKNAANYVQTLSAFADSPRKFLMSVKRIKFEDVFDNERGFKLAGKRMLESSWKIYDKSNENLDEDKKAKTIRSQEEFNSQLRTSINNEIAMWNENAKDLINNKTIPAEYFKDGKLSKEGENKIAEFVFNQSVNGMALAEIFNPGIPFNDIVKRNKGNSSPILTFGNKNLKMEAIPIDDTGKRKSQSGKEVDVEDGSNSGMYMTEKMAQKIIDAGLGVFDLNGGLKLLNYHVERDNPNFKGMAAYFKGYTTIISEKTLITEPGLRGVFRLLTEREEAYNSHHRKTYGKEPSLDITNGEHNYINYAVPSSAIKSDFFSAEQKAALAEITYENLENAENSSEVDDNLFDKVNATLDSLYYGTDKKGDRSFMGLSTNNFGPQQIMDKVTTEAITPVQFMSAVVVNGMVGDNLAMGEEIQKFIRQDMTDNLDKIIDELGDMNPIKYKAFILKNLDLENMDQGQRLMIEESLTNLNHPAIADFITNTLANRLKQAGNKLKTAGSVTQQKPSLHYRLRDGITVNGNNTLQGHNDRYNEDGSVGSQVMEIVLPNHMKGKVEPRQYLTMNDPQVIRIIGMREDLQKMTSKAKIDGNYNEVLKEVALSIARVRHGKARPKGSYGHDVSDYIGSYEKDGQFAGWFVRGENVIGTRIPSHGPASTGVFEAIDFLEGVGNQSIVHEDFSVTAGSDYDGDSLFVQSKSGSGPNFKQALNKTVDLWTSPGMRMQIRAKIEFKATVEKIVGNNKTKKSMPMSPEYHRSAYNNTMISKRNIGIIFNTHRIANYLAAYNVGLSEPINIDGTRAEAFSDKEVGQESRNNQSAMLANIILDNAKWGFADSLGLNDQTINQYALLVNLGFSLKQLNSIMNSKAVKVWNKYQSNNNNPFSTRLKNADVKKEIYKELGLDDKKVKNTGINTDPMMINTKEQMKQIIQLMERLESVNADVLHVSKIMAGHKGIENNPFILEQQLKDYDAVIHSDKKNPLLVFPETFKNNPDIKAYQENAGKILEIMKKANNIYNASTSKLMQSLNEKIGYDDTMDKGQMNRASELIKRFHTSRILGHNNISAEQKQAIKKQVFRDVKNYMAELESTELPGNRKANALDKSVLFNRALNMDMKYASGQKNVSDPAKVFDEKSYISANPRFFNESLTEEDRKSVQEEWKALPQEIKDGLITLDLMKNGLTGKLSLSIIFDEQTNHDISTYAAHESKTKNDPISPDVMTRLEELIISNEFNENKSILNASNPKAKFKPGGSLLGYIAENNPSLDTALRMGSGMIFKIDGKPYIYEGVSKTEKDNFKKDYADSRERADAIGNLIIDRIRPFKKFDGDINLEVISLVDSESRPVYKAKKSAIGKMNQFMGQASEKFDENSKKKVKPDLGNASVIDYHNYNDVAPLNQREFNVAMEYDNTISDEQKAFVYKKYLEDKKEANNLTAKLNQRTFAEMSDDELKKVYHSLAQKDLYAYSIIITPMLMEYANRLGKEQSDITGAFEDGKDISLMDSYFDNNNITSKHPVTQGLVRKLKEEYRKFVNERGNYIKIINEVTDTLYKEKFNLSGNSWVRTAQRIGQSLFHDRNDIYQKLYGNLLSEETYTDTEGVIKKDLKFKEEAEIQKLYNENKISKAEFDFYTTFKKVTSHLKNHDSNDKVRKGYIPHTAMNNFEMYSGRGLLGLLVNSKGINSVIGDVKVYSDVTGKRKLMTFEDVRNHYNALALSKKQTTKDLVAFGKLKMLAKKLQKTGKNEDGSRIIYSSMQNETLLGMSPMSRFESSRSGKAELMPSMDLNKALIDYVHTSLFTNGNENFQGFKAMMPMIDGVMAYNDKNGFKNAYNYVKEVVKEGFIMKKDQAVFGKNADSVINGIVKSNTFYALGYKGLLIGKGLYAIGNIASGKYMNIKREGGKAWAIGEARYWGIDKGISLDTLDRRRRADNILKNIGYMEADFYDDVDIESKTGLDSVFTKIALSPMAATENWIQKVQMLGMLTKEEFDLFDNKGEYKTGAVQLTEERISKLEERVKTSQGKGFSPTDQSRIHQTALGRMFMQFSRHLPAQIRERFGKDEIDMNGQKYIGSLRQIGRTGFEIINNRMSPAKFKEYYASLEPHEKEALLSGLRGAALMTMLGFIAGNSNEESQMVGAKTDASSIASGAMNDANVWADPDKFLTKTIPPAIRSTLSVLKAITHGGQGEIEK